MLGSLAILRGVKYSTLNMHNLNTNQMNQVIKEAVEVSLSLYDKVDSYKLPSDAQVKHVALGQCLRSLVELLENESRASNPAT